MQRVPFQALADDIRLRIVRLLSGSGLEATPGQLALTLQILPSHLSRHMEVLVWAGLITLRRHEVPFSSDIQRVQSSCDVLCSAVLSMPDEVGGFFRKI